MKKLLCLVLLLGACERDNGEDYVEPVVVVTPTPDAPVVTPPPTTTTPVVTTPSTETPVGEVPVLTPPPVAETPAPNPVYPEGSPAKREDLYYCKGKDLRTGNSVESFISVFSDYSRQFKTRIFFAEGRYEDFTAVELSYDGKETVTFPSYGEYRRALRGMNTETKQILKLTPDSNWQLNITSTASDTLEMSVAAYDTKLDTTTTLDLPRASCERIGD